MKITWTDICGGIILGTLFYAIMEAIF